MPNRSCLSHEDHRDREAGRHRQDRCDCRGVELHRDFCNYKFKRDEKRHSCSSRGRECSREGIDDFNCNDQKDCGQTDRFDAQRLTSGCRSRNVKSPVDPIIDCPRLREKSTEACSCNRPKTDCRTSSGKPGCDRRPKTVEAGTSSYGCQANGSSSDYRRSAVDDYCASRCCKLDGADEPSRRRCRRSTDNPRSEVSSLPTAISGIKCDSRQKCRASSRNTPLPAVYENLGGGLNCRRCDGKVYHAEMQLVSGAAYHRICFSCFCCRKPLEPLTYQEHCGEIFCKQCYTRNFGPQGYGYGMGAGVLQTPL